MSPVSSSSTVYDHLVIGPQSQMRTNFRNNNTSNNNNTRTIPLIQSRSEPTHWQVMSKRKSMLNGDPEQSKRRITVTHVSIPETKIHRSVNNQLYDHAPPLQKSITTHTVFNQIHPEMSTHTIAKSSSMNSDSQPMDFRPLITYGRRKFRPLSPSSPMIIIRKKNSISNQNPISSQVNSDDTIDSQHFLSPNV